MRKLDFSEMARDAPHSAAMIRRSRKMWGWDITMGEHLLFPRDRLGNHATVVRKRISEQRLPALAKVGIWLDGRVV
jgi:hypothetical protein